MIHKSHNIFLVIFLAFSNDLAEHLGNAQQGCVDSNALCPSNAEYCDGYENMKKECPLTCKLCKPAASTTVRPSAPVNPSLSSAGWTKASTTVVFWQPTFSSWTNVTNGAADVAPVSRISLLLVTPVVFVIFSAPYMK